MKCGKCPQRKTYSAFVREESKFALSLIDRLRFGNATLVFQGINLFPDVLDVNIVHWNGHARSGNRSIGTSHDMVAVKLTKGKIVQKGVDLGVEGITGQAFVRDKGAKIPQPKERRLLAINRFDFHEVIDVLLHLVLDLFVRLINEAKICMRNDGGTRRVFVEGIEEISTENKT